MQSHERDVMTPTSNGNAEAKQKAEEKTCNNEGLEPSQRHDYSPNETVLLNAGVPIPDQAARGEC